MKIGVLSDTHGSTESLTKAQEIFNDCGVIFHAGDVLYHGPRNPLPAGYDPQQLSEQINNLAAPIFIARGNCDAEVDELVLQAPLLTPYFYSYMEGLKILLLHGTGYNESNLVELGLKYGVNVVIFGHTHIPVLKEESGVVLLNPGSPALPKSSSATVGLIDTNANKAGIMDLEENKCVKELEIFNAKND